MNPLPPIRLAIADDHEIVRKAMINLFELEGVYQFCIEAGDGKALIEQLKAAPLLPDICILDIVMPVMDGHETLLEIRKLWPQMPVLVLTSYYSNAHLQRMFKDGANGYLRKDCTTAQFHQAVRDIYETGAHYSGAFSPKKMPSVPQQSRDLTSRETEFLKYCCSDKTYNEIAQEMHVTPKTVEWYRSNIFRKIKVVNRLGLILYALQEGIIPWDIF